QGAASEQHPLEAKEVTWRRVQPMTGGPPVGVLVPVEVDGGPIAFVVTYVYRNEVGALVGADEECPVPHPQRLQYLLVEVLVQSQTGNRLDYRAQPVDADAVLECGAGIG